MRSRRRKAVRANTVNNADTERDRATPVQDMDICMYVYMYVIFDRWMDGWMDGWMDR